jgi:acetyl esterase/lipase
VSLRLHRDHGWRVYEMAPWGRALPAHRVIYFHGGGYVSEVDSAHWGMCRRMARLVPARVSLPIYPLAPGATAASTVATAVQIAADALRAAGADHLVTLMGDSAGGGLALAVAQGLRDKGVGRPGLVLIAPWVDLSMNDEGIDPATRDPMLSVPRLRRAGEMYAGELPITDPRVSPLHGDLSGLGPMTILVGTRDLLLRDAQRLRDLAVAQGVPVDYHEAEGLIHVWPLLPLPEARRARATLVESIRGSARAPRPRASTD